MYSFFGDKTQSTVCMYDFGTIPRTFLSLWKRYENDLVNNVPITI